MNVTRRTMTVREAADALGCGATTLRHYIVGDGTRIEFDSGQSLPIIRLGTNGRIRIPAIAVERLLGETRDDATEVTS